MPTGRVHNVKTEQMHNWESPRGDFRPSLNYTAASLPTRNYVTKSDEEEASYDNSAKYTVPEPSTYERPDIDQIKREIKRLKKRYDDDIASLKSELSALRN